MEAGSDEAETTDVTTLVEDGSTVVVVSLKICDDIEEAIEEENEASAEDDAAEAEEIEERRLDREVEATAVMVRVCDVVTSRRPAERLTCGVGGHSEWIESTMDRNKQKIRHVARTGVWSEERLITGGCGGGGRHA